MALTARELIIDAYYLSGIRSRTFQSVSGQDITDGLKLLNKSLAVENIDGLLIPYFRSEDITAVAGQEKYFISNLIDAETLTFNIGPVRYSMEKRSRNKYFGNSRVDNIESLPFTWHLERTLNGSNIYLYFLPEDAYDIELWGKFGFSQVASLGEDLLLTHPLYYLDYIEHVLAREICKYNHQEMPRLAEQSLRQLQEKLILVSPMDLSTEIISAFGADSIINYGDVNFGKGWRP